MNPERRDGRPRLVRSQINPEYRELRVIQQRGKEGGFHVRHDVHDVVRITSYYADNRREGFAPP